MSTPAPTPGVRRRRLLALMRKEGLQVLRDPSSIAIAFLMPLFLLLLFGYGVSLDADHVPVAFVAEQPTADTRDFEASLRGSHYFAVLPAPSMHAAEQAMREGGVNAIVRLRADFSERLRRPDGAPIQVIVNGVDANTAGFIPAVMRPTTKPGRATTTSTPVPCRASASPDANPSRPALAEPYT